MRSFMFVPLKLLEPRGHNCQSINFVKGGQRIATGLSKHGIRLNRSVIKPLCCTERKGTFLQFYTAALPAAMVEN